MAVVSLLGQVFIQTAANSPFLAMRELLPKLKQETNIIILDFHAEATSEKIAMGWFLDGEVSCIFGTHTHVQTADEHILPKGTAYITDVGMCGPFDSVIGRKKERIIESYNRIINLKKQFNIIKKEASEIKAEKFELIGLPNAVTFGQALDYAKYAQKATGIRPAFLMGVLREELSLVGEYGMCYLTNFKNGDGITTDGKVLKKTMHPTRDVPGFLAITKELGRDPYKTLVTCPMSFGFGGAMGPADFIPSTWLRYKEKIKAITGEVADPWNTRDAFLAAGIYLSESGAVSNDKNGEWKSAMIYFSGSATSPYAWYANGAILIAQKVQTYIDQIEKAK